MKPRVVVTGSEGFVGRHLRAAFLARGVEVVGVGRPGSGAEIEIDLAARDLDVAAVVRRIGPVTGVVYLAAMIVRTSSVDAVARENLEVIATRAAEWMEATQAGSPGAHFVYCSTLKAYGPATVQPIDPMLPPQEPDPWSYGSAKAFAERILEIGAARSGASHCVVRLTYVYGPGQHPGNAIPAFLRACWAGQAPVIFGEGAEVRDDVYAPDVAYILAEACMRRARGAFHAGSGRGLTLLETAKACCRAVEALGGPAGLAPILDASKPPKWWLDRTFDVARTRALLDYEPTSLEEALRREAEWVRDGAAADQAITAAPADCTARGSEVAVSRVVVTGATGRLGRSLVTLLAERGHDVVAVPRSVDLATDAAIASLTQWLRAGDVVVHLAAIHPADPSATSFAELRALIDVNVLGTMRLLDACRAARPAKLVFPSTHEVVAIGAPHEPAAVVRRAPRNDFAATKLAGEDHLRSFEGEEAVPFTALRLAPTAAAAEALEALRDAVESPAAGIVYVASREPDGRAG